MKTLLECKNLTKNFGSLEILKGINLKLGEGESAAILGPSGAGKSTLLHIAGLMEKPSNGDVFIDGAKVDAFSPAERAGLRLEKIGFLFQFHYLLPEFSVLENVLIPSRLAGDDLAKSEARAREILERLGLQDRMNHRPYQLSGGEQQRTAMARAVIREPKVLLCDEPTGNLDPETGARVIDLLWEEIRRHQCAVVIVTHNKRIAEKAGMAMSLDHGRLTQVEGVLNV